MSLSTRNPLRLAGANVNSGQPNTGELPFIRGGMACASIFSGTANLSGVIPTCTTAFGVPDSAGGYDLKLVSGAGRLNSVLAFNSIQSGQTVTFYDGAVATSGGPFSASGHKIIGVMPSVFQQGGASGFNQQIIFTGQPFNVDFPFTSGLIVAQKSGQGGFSVTYTVETPVSTAG